MTDLSVRNGRIWTQDPASPWAEAAVIRDGRFAFVGREVDLPAPAGTAVVDARGGLVLPGFCDAHAHLMSTGFARQQLQLKDVRTVAEVQRLVANRAGSLQPGTWIQGSGWDQNLWPGARFPTREDLDGAAPNNPVFLVHTSAHCAWVNSAALRIARIDALTEAPNGGQIDRDSSGEPTGILRDNAIDLVRRHIPRPGPAERREALREAISHALAHGLTAVHAMDVGASELEALEALEAEGALALRVRAFLTARDLQRWEGRRTGDGTELLAIGGVKFFADGALGSVTAWMVDPYEGTAETGFPLQPADELEAGVRWCLEHGLAPAIHAIGDRANAEVVAILERLRHLAPDLPRRIEHAQLLRQDLPGRMAALSLTASVQPIHATQDMDKVDRLWGGRGRLAIRSRPSAPPA
ncbi:MAG: amidohydrolase [Hyphomicrobiales bacterium]